MAINLSYGSVLKYPLLRLDWQNWRWKWKNWNLFNSLCRYWTDIPNRLLRP